MENRKTIANQSGQGARLTEQSGSPWWFEHNASLDFPNIAQSFLKFAVLALCQLPDHGIGGSIPRIKTSFQNVKGRTHENSAWLSNYERSKTIRRHEQPI